MRLLRLADRLVVPITGMLRATMAVRVLRGLAARLVVALLLFRSNWPRGPRDPLSTSSTKGSLGPNGPARCRLYSIGVLLVVLLSSAARGDVPDFVREFMGIFATHTPGLIAEPERVVVAPLSLLAFLVRTAPDARVDRGRSDSVR